MGPSLLVSAASPLARLQPAMPTPYRNGCGSKEKKESSAKDAAVAEEIPCSKRTASARTVHEGATPAVAAALIPRQRKRAVLH